MLLLTLLVVAVVGVVGTAALRLGSQVTRQEAEEALLHQGRQFQQALSSYIDSSPGAAVLGPRSMDELLRDQRFAGVRRHLRQVPADPLTGRVDWGVQRSPDGQITGIYSLAPGKPIKRAGFDPDFARLADAISYQEWIFGPPPVPPLPAGSGNPVLR